MPGCGDRSSCQPQIWLSCIWTNERAGNKIAFELFSQSRYLIISTFQAFERYAFIKQKITPTKYPSVAVKAVSMILFQPVNKAIWISSEGFGGFDSYKSHDVKQNFRSVPKHMQCDSRQWKLHNAILWPNNVFRLGKESSTNVDGLQLYRSKPKSDSWNVPSPSWACILINMFLTATSHSQTS